VGEHRDFKFAMQVDHIMKFQPLRLSEFKNKDGRHPLTSKMEKLWYLHNHLTDFNEIWHGDAFINLKIQDGRRPSSSKNFFKSWSPFMHL